MIKTGSCHVNRSSSRKFDLSYQFSLKFNFIFSNINYENYPSLILEEDRGKGEEFSFLSHHTWKVAGSNLIWCLAEFCDSTWLRNGLPKSQNSDRECNDEHLVSEVVIGPKMT